MEENKYKAALERAKEIYFNKEYKPNEAALVKEILTELFPELGETEDEKTRKELVEWLKSKLGNPSIGFNPAKMDKWIAYLEKVKDFDEQLEQAYKNSDEVQYKRGYEDALAFLNKANEEAIREIGNEIKLPIIGQRKTDGGIIGKMQGLEKQAAIKDGNSIDPQFAKPITTTETKYPKFKIGDWVVDEEDNHVYQVKRVVTNVSSGMSGYDLSDGGYFYSTKTNCHLWSIADAKDGDVLSYVTDEEDLWILIYRSLYEPYEGHVHYHALLVNDNFYDEGTCCITINDLKPATKEQRDKLFKAMADKGYEWDAEKKELNKIELNPDDLIAEAYQQQADDLIDMVTEKPVWSEDDEKNLQGLIDEIQVNKSNAPEYDLKTYDRFLSWLKSLKNRVQPQPKQEWGKEDEMSWKNAIEAAVSYFGLPSETVNWLKSLKQRMS